MKISDGPRHSCFRFLCLVELCCFCALCLGRHGFVLVSVFFFFLFAVVVTAVATAENKRGWAWASERDRQLETHRERQREKPKETETETKTETGRETEYTNSARAHGREFRLTSEFVWRQFSPVIGDERFRLYPEMDEVFFHIILNYFNLFGCEQYFNILFANNLFELRCCS